MEHDAGGSWHSDFWVEFEFMIDTHEAEFLFTASAGVEDRAAEKPGSAFWVLSHMIPEAPVLEPYDSQGVQDAKSELVRLDPRFFRTTSLGTTTSTPPDTPRVVPLCNPVFSVDVIGFAPEFDPAAELSYLQESCNIFLYPSPGSSELVSLLVGLHGSLELDIATKAVLVLTQGEPNFPHPLDDFIREWTNLYLVIGRAQLAGSSDHVLDVVDGHRRVGIHYIPIGIQPYAEREVVLSSLVVSAKPHPLHPVSVTADDMVKGRRCLVAQEIIVFR